MADSQQQETAHQLGRRQLWGLGAGVFLASFSLLAFEITLSRVLSVLLSYHYVFVVVSLALLGLGTGGLFVHVLRRGGSGRTVPLPLSASLFGISIPLSVMLMTWMAGNGFIGLLAYLVVLFVPFFFAGVFAAELFRSFPGLASLLYGLDLTGAAVGALGAIPVLNSLGGVSGSLLLGVTAAVAAVLVTISVPGRKMKTSATAGVCFVIVVALLSTNLAGLYVPRVPVGSSPDKEISRALAASPQQGQIVATRWSAFGRTDAVAFNSDPSEMDIYLDGTAGTAMYKFNGDIQAPDAKVAALREGFLGYLPLSELRRDEKDSALIIGPGGGRDVLVALLAGVGQITAVEVNRDLLDIVAGYSSYNGGIYTGVKNVSVVAGEGRSFLKRQKDKYDIIMLSLPVTKTSRSLEGFALTESFLFTTEAIGDYLDHLTDEGRLVVVAHDMAEVLKLFSVSLAALGQRGIDNGAAMSRVYTVGTHMLPVFVMKKTPFDQREMLFVHRTLHQAGYDPGTSYLPAIKLSGGSTHDRDTLYDECSMFNPLFTALSKGELGVAEMAVVARELGLDARPASDDSPFFYKFETGIPEPVTTVYWTSAIVLGLVTLVPLSRLRKSRSRRKPRAERSPGNLPRFLAFFSILGAGFMLVEISVIQRFTLFLGQPVLSLAVLLFSLLVGAGIGSLASGRVPVERTARGIAVACLSIAGVLLVQALVVPALLERLLGAELPLRLLIAVALLLPVGFVMGFPFPLGLRLLREAGKEDLIPWMWSVNGVASVLGSALTVLVAIAAGFTEAALLGAGLYFCAFLVMRCYAQPRASTST